MGMDAGLARQRWEPVTAALTLILFALLLFTRLGHYPLWDDEALTALEAQSVWNTGDTSAIHGQNIIAFRKGISLQNLENRAEPPLQFYFLAPFTPLAGKSNFLLRLPFALVGLACLALVLYWLHHDRAGFVLYLLICIGILTNVSLILYCRQCRYYSLLIFSSLTIAYIYMHWTGKWSNVLWLVVFSIALLLTNYLSWLALYVAMTIDWRLARRRIRWRASQLAVLLLPQAAIVAYIALTRHQIISHYSQLYSARGFARLTHVWYMLRDLNTNEFCTWAVIIFAAIVAYFRRDQQILRAVLALLVYVCISAAFYSTPAPIGEIRYVAPIIPLAIVIEAYGLAWLINRQLSLGIAVTAVVFGTNVLNLFPPPASDWAMPIPVRSTIVDYVRELINPPDNPYAPAIAWLKRNVHPGQSVGVLPGHMIYPLMLYDPEIIYAWQLDWPPEKQFAALPRINFVDQESPDYFLAFDSYRQQLEYHLNHIPGLDQYRLIAVLPHFGIDHYRPELFWRVFKTIPVANPQTDAIYIYSRSTPQRISTSDK